MRFVSRIVVTVAAAVAAVSAGLSTTGVEALVQRRLPQHASSFQFELVNLSTTGNDSYVVTTTDDSRILVQGNTLSALLSGYVASSRLTDN